MFLYKPKNNKFDFELKKDSHTNTIKPQMSKVSLNIDENKEYINYLFNTNINNDIITRDIVICAGKQKHKAVMYSVDGLVNKQLINENILEPLMRFQDTDTGDGITAEYIISRLIPQVQVEVSDDIYDIAQKINFGNVIMFIDGIGKGIVADVKTWEHRNISEPNSEQVIQGPQEGFNEVLRCNTALVRKAINNSNLIVQNISAGKTSKTPGSVLYLKNVANSNLVKEVIRRVEGIDCEYILSTLDVEQYIEEASYLPIPQMITTERPDRVCKSLIEGRVALMLNGSSHALIMPATIFDLASSVEDDYLRYPYSLLIRVVRFMAIFISTLAPAIFIAVTQYHQDLILNDLFLSIQSSRAAVPFSIVFELLIMELSFELIREAGIRVPGHIGSTLGIVGGLILGTAAVDANIVSPLMIIVVAITGISSFAIPSYSLSFALRFSRFIYVLGAAICGFPGLLALLFANTVMYMGTKSFGVPYMSPVAPKEKSGYLNLLFRKPIWKQDERPSFLKPKDKNDKAHISRKWLGGNKK